MQSWAPLVESVVVPLGICLAAAGLFLLFWLARDRPKAVWAAPKQYFRGSRYSLAWMQKISCGICFQVAFMVTLFLFTVDFDRQAMSTRLYVLLNSTLLLFLTVAVVGGVMCFIVRNDLLLLFVVFGSSSGFVAICSGMMLYDTYVVTSRLASEGKHFVGVSPRSHAAGYRDAGTIEFAPLAVLDLERAVGYKSGSTYCAAPIVQDYTDTTPVQFWAIGTNCCSSRGTFTCASQTYPLYGSVVQQLPVSNSRVDWPWGTAYDQYSRAVDMASADISTNLIPIFVSLGSPPKSGYTTYNFACDSSFLALNDANVVIMVTTSFKYWVPSRGGSNWYNLIALHKGTQRYLSTNAIGVLATAETDSGSGFERWIISAEDGSVRSLMPTSKGTYLGCHGAIGPKTGAGKWNIAGWNFGEAKSAGKLWGTSAIFFFGSLAALYWYMVFSVIYFLFVLILLGMIPQPMGEDKDPH
eukprot:GEMP01024266.1.p1 GENE.GEMP01024266.1~~GEMP01024266.1.p1  ORF type:complete len:468 (+),score=57.22 GEMP01024266.1:91-1494(+)